MSSWWMLDNGDNKKEGVLKREQAVSPSVQPYLGIEPTLKGYLDKLSRFNTWQLRYYELRGPYLMYWPNANVASVSSTADHSVAHPLGVVDVRQVTSNHISKSDNLLQLSLNHGKKVVKLRLASSSHVKATALSRRPSYHFKERSKKEVSLEDWHSSIEMNTNEVSNPLSSECSPHTILDQNRLDKDRSSRSAQVIEHEGERVSLTSASLSHMSDSHTSAQTTHSMAGDSSFSNNEGVDIELKTYANIDVPSNSNMCRPPLGRDDDGRDNGSNKKRESNKHMNGDDYSMYSGHGSGTGNRMPVFLHLFLALTGVMLFKRSFENDCENDEDDVLLKFAIKLVPKRFILAMSKVYLIFMRLLLVTCGVFFILKVFIWQDMTAEQREFLLLDKVYFTCSSTMSIEEGAPDPCLLVLARLAVLPVLGFFSLLVYGWVIAYGFNYDTLMRTHQARLAPRVNRISVVVLSQVACCFVAMVIMFPIYMTSYLKDKFGLNDSDEYYVFQVRVQVVSGAFCGFLLGPFSLLGVLLHVETRRIRYVVADFIRLFDMKPFNFSHVAGAFSEVVDEYRFVQAKYGVIVGTTTVGLTAVFVMTFVQTYYITEEYKGLEATSVFIAFLFYSVLLTTTSLPIFMMIRSMVLINNAGDAMHEVALELLTTLPSACTGRSANDSDNGEGSGMSCTSIHDLRANDAMRLFTIIDKTPCELLMLGYKVEPGDGAKLAAFIAAFQLASFTGVDWIFG